MRSVTIFFVLATFSVWAQGPFYQVNTDVSETIQDLFFKDSLTGYGVGGSDSWGSSQSSGGFILKTTDGGENWTTIFSKDSLTIRNRVMTS